MEKNPALIGVLGGSFDPIHLGHLHLARVVLSLYPMEKLLLIPNNQNPIKQTVNAPGALRLKMIQAALSESPDPRLEACDLEIKREGPSFTIDTLKLLKKKEEKDLILILGNEIFEELPRWHEPKQILESAHCAVVNRNPHAAYRPIELLKKLHILDGEIQTENRITHTANLRWIERKDIEPLPYSSTELRREIKEKWNKNDLQDPPQGIQRSVWLLIKGNHLYTR